MNTKNQEKIPISKNDSISSQASSISRSQSIDLTQNKFVQKEQRIKAMRQQNNKNAFTIVNSQVNSAAATALSLANQRKIEKDQRTQALNSNLMATILPRCIVEASLSNVKNTLSETMTNHSKIIRKSLKMQSGMNPIQRIASGLSFNRHNNNIITKNRSKNHHLSRHNLCEETLSSRASSSSSDLTSNDESESHFYNKFANFSNNPIIDASNSKQLRRKCQSENVVNFPGEIANNKFFVQENQKFDSPNNNHFSKKARKFKNHRSTVAHNRNFGATNKKSELMTICSSSNLSFNNLSKSIENIDHDKHIKITHPSIFSNKYSKGKRGYMLDKDIQEQAGKQTKKVNFQRNKSYSHLPRIESRSHKNNIMENQTTLDNFRTRSLGHISTCTNSTTTNPNVDLVVSALDKNNKNNATSLNNNHHSIINFDENIEIQKNIKILDDSSVFKKLMKNCLKAFFLIIAVFLVIIISFLVARAVNADKYDGVGGHKSNNNNKIVDHKISNLPINNFSYDNFDSFPPELFEQDSNLAQEKSKIEQQIEKLEIMETRLVNKINEFFSVKEEDARENTLNENSNRNFNSDSFDQESSLDIAAGGLGNPWLANAGLGSGSFGGSYRVEKRETGNL